MVAKNTDNHFKNNKTFVQSIPKIVHIKTRFQEQPAHSYTDYFTAEQRMVINVSNTDNDLTKDNLTKKHIS